MFENIKLKTNKQTNKQTGSNLMFAIEKECDAGNNWVFYPFCFSLK